MTARTPQRQVGTPDGNVVLDLFVLHQRIGELMELALAGTGVRPAEYAVYSQLALASMTPRELCARLGVTPSTLTGHLSALARRDHVSRVRDPSDGRSYRLELTDEGHRVTAECRSGFRRMLRRLNSALPVPPDEVRETLASLDHAAEAVANALGAPPPSGPELERRGYAERAT